MRVRITDRGGDGCCGSAVVDGWYARNEEKRKLLRPDDVETMLYG
jgi:hypothetical protein